VLKQLANHSQVRQIMDQVVSYRVLSLAGMLETELPCYLVTNHAENDDVN